MAPVSTSAAALLGCTALALSASGSCFVVPRSGGLPSAPSSTTTSSRGRSLRMMAKPMTLTEKILAKAAGREHVSPNDNIWVQVDNLMTHDVCGPGTFGTFKKEFGPNAKVSEREREGEGEGRG